MCDREQLSEDSGLGSETPVGSNVATRLVAGFVQVQLFAELACNTFSTPRLREFCSVPGLGRWLIVSQDARYVRLYHAIRSQAFMSCHRC